MSTEVKPTRILEKKQTKATISQIKVEIETFVDYLSCIENEEPEIFEKQINTKLNYINTISLNYIDIRKELMKFCFEICGKKIDKGIMHPHGRYKPLGYPGDFQIIDWIYTKKTDLQSPGKLWDEFFHQQVASQAVLNRKEFFCEVFVNSCEKVSGSLSVLDLASGSCRDLMEGITRAGSKVVGSHFHCVDMDERAILYAKDLLEEQITKASFYFEKNNVFKIKPSRHYDLIWSAGLFDYLSDRYAITLLKKMWKWVCKGGKIIIGNFSTTNPSRNYMEWCGEWFLIHRTKEAMLKLCQQAGIPEESVTFAKEPLGVNIFLIVTRQR